MREALKGLSSFLSAPFFFFFSHLFTHLHWPLSQCIEAAEIKRKRERERECAKDEKKKKTHEREKKKRTIKKAEGRASFESITS